MKLLLCRNQSVRAGVVLHKNGVTNTYTEDLMLHLEVLDQREYPLGIRS
jgi:hypothetical protein